MAETNWLEVSLTVNGELAEAIAEVLSRFAHGGVVIETTAINPDSPGEGSPLGIHRVYGFLPVDENLEVTRHKLEEALWYLGRIITLPSAQYRILPDANWSESWKQHYRPIPIGRRLIVVPAWLESPDPDRIAIRLEPGMAFGTGTHPTTQLCLEIIEEQVLRRASSTPSAVVDLGCGSGILSIAAAKLGASPVLGVDIDPQAIKAARENAAANGVDDRLELGLGSLAQIQAGVYSIRAAGLVLVNILAPVIIDLLEEGLAGLVSRGGMLALSGILQEQADDVEIALHKHNMRTVDRRQRGDWVALIATT